ncbi:MAG: efflux transporter outer membrane subunit [Gammaproteobacteria bacterium]
MSYTRLVAMLAMLALSACAVGPKYTRPPQVTFNDRWVGTTDSSPVDAAWWHSLNDPMLSDLVDLAVSQNLDIKVADARLREARANRDAAAGQRLPQADLSASAARHRISENGEIPIARIPGFKRDLWLYEVGFDASWEIDLWGHQSSAVQAASARTEVAADARRDTLVRVVAEVVRSYVDLRGAQEQSANATADAQAQDSVATLIDERFRAGESSRFDYLRAQAQAHSTRAAVAGFEATAQAAAYQLALLTGQPPEALTQRLSVAANLPKNSATVNAGLRSDLLRRRPDVRRAERQLAAATADAGVATAELFPRLSLVGSIGQQSQTGGDLLTQGSSRFSVGPSLHWPIFAGGTIRANIRAANARTDSAAAIYESAVLTALKDSETAINRFTAAKSSERDRELARQLSEEALNLARQRYRAGEDDLIVLLNAQSAYMVAEQQDITARTATLEALASLYKSLGGGWQDLEARTAVSIDHSSRGSPLGN